MQKLPQFKSQHLFPNPYGNVANPTSPLGSFRPSIRTQIRMPIICAKKNNNRGLFGSKKSRKAVIQLVHFVATNFNVLPEPWNSMVRQFGGGGRGGGSGSGFGKGFFGWGGRRRGRGRKKKVGFWVLLVMAFGLGMWLILGKEVEFHVFVGGVCLFILMAVANGWNKEGVEWALGLCCGANLVVLGMRREDLGEWIKKFRIVESGRRRNDRRAM